MKSAGIVESLTWFVGTAAIATLYTIGGVRQDSDPGLWAGGFFAFSALVWLAQLIRAIYRRGYQKGKEAR